MNSRDMYSGEEFKQAFEKLRLFRIKAPYGGQANDGFELLGTLAFADYRELVNTLDLLGVDYELHREKPDCWTPPPFLLDNSQHWITYTRHCECFGYQTYVLIGTTDCTIEFNFNSSSWYEVQFEDLIRALAFEQVLEEYGLLPKS